MKYPAATTRGGGGLLRYHTMACIHPQTVAEHSWNVARIYTERYKMPRAEVYFYILYHDVAEVITGDIPFLVKRRYPHLKEVLNEAEKDAYKQLTIILPKLTDTEMKQIKICDLIEMGEYALGELRMGNLDMQIVVDNIDEALNQMGTSINDRQHTYPL